MTCKVDKRVSKLWGMIEVLRRLNLFAPNKGEILENCNTMKFIFWKCFKGRYESNVSNLFLSNPAITKAARLTDWTIKETRVSEDWVALGSVTWAQCTSSSEWQVLQMHVWSSQRWLNFLPPKSLVPHKFTDVWTVRVGSTPVVWVQWDLWSGTARVAKQMETSAEVADLRRRWQRKARAVLMRWWSATAVSERLNGETRIRRVRPNRNMKDVLRLHVNAKPHTSLRTRGSREAMGWTVLLRSAHSPDLATSNCLLFGQ
jgi:hypothetical protein